MFQRHELQHLLDRVFKYPTIRETHNLDLLRSLWQAFPDPQALNVGADRLTRLRDALRDITIGERSFWDEQIALSVSRKSAQGYALTAAPLSESLTPPQILWFHLYRQLKTLHAPEEGRTANAVVFVSEPLFFYSAQLRAFVRFLDLNWQNKLDEKTGDQLVRQVVDRISRDLTDVPRDTIKRVLEQMQFSPVFHYAPAGDAHAAVTLRRFFRRELKVAPNYLRGARISTEVLDHSHLIIIGNARTNEELRAVQEEYRLPARIEDEGVSVNGEFHKDEINTRGTSRAWAIFTCWRFQTGNMLYVIASNHARASGRLAEALVNESDCAAWIEGLTDEKGRIPDRFQMVFRVPLVSFETKALLPEPLKPSHIFV